MRKIVEPAAHRENSAGGDRPSIPPIVETIASAAAANPDAEAVYAGEAIWRYRDLLGAARQIRDRFNAWDADRTPTAFVAKRSAASLAIMLGGLLARRPFAPIDPHDPDATSRARRMGARRLVLDPDAFLNDGRFLELDEPISLTERTAWIEPGAYRLLTSGTSSRSKLVEVSQSNLSAYAAFLRRRLGLDQPMQWAAVSSLATDLSYTALFPVLASGGTVHIVDDTTRRDGRAFRRYVAAHEIDAVKMTPSHCRALLSARDERVERSLRMLVLGGEPLQPDLGAAMLDTGQAERVVNHYGPTETTIGVACHIVASRAEIDFDARTLPIGTPLGEAELVVIDEAGRPVPVGAAGELLIGGPTVATGYVNDAALTAQRFIMADPNGAGRRRFFRTDDFCRWLESGALEFVRRGGTEVKIRGWRVEPADVEQTICALQGVRDARIVLDGNGSSASLDAIVVADQQTSDTVRASLFRLLPRHLIPRRIIIVQALPVLNSGKFDKTAALQLLNEGWTAATTRDEPDPLVDEIASLMAPYLNGVRPGPADDFSSLGGDSLAAIHLLSRLQEHGHDLSAETLLRDLTPQGIATSIRAARCVPPRARLERHAGGLSPAQTWFFAQHFADPNRWCQGVALDAAGPIDDAALDAALNWVVGRHPVLRCRFERDEVQPAGWRCRPGSTSSAARAHAEDWDGSDAGLRAITERLLREIDIESGRLLAASSLTAPDGCGRVIVLAHHLVVDGVSWRILLDDLVAAYEAARDGALTEPYPEPGAFWDWVDALAPLTPAAAPPSGPTEPPADMTASATFDETMTTALEHAALLSGRGVHTILLAAFAAEWAGITGEAALSIDIESYGRTGKGADTGRVVGWFTRTSAISLFVRDPNNFDALLEAIGASLDAVEFKDHAYAETAPLCFNYLGRFVAPADGVGRWSYSSLILGPLRGANRRGHAVTLSGRIISGRLSFEMVFDTHRLASTDGEALTRRIAARLTAFATSPETPRFAAPALRLLAWSTIGQLALASPSRSAAVRSVVRTEPSLLLTGATGLFGAYLLREFLKGSAREIACLVRPDANAGGAARLARIFSQYFDADISAYGDRVRVIEGDVTKPKLGLSHELHEELAHRLSTVVHSAADVRLFANEQHTHAVNVDGTQNIIAFAETGRPKAIHLMSTMSVAGLWRGTEPRPFNESDLDYGQDFRSAYERSKLRAEELLRQFVARGGVGWAHRLGSLAAPAGPGRSQINLGANRIAQTIRLYARCGVAPKLPDEFLLLTPVDLAARAVVALATRARLAGATTHLILDSASDHDDIIETLRRMGHSVEIVTAAAFRERTREERSGELVRWWLSHGARRVRVQSSRTAALLAQCEALIEVDRREAWLERVVSDALHLPDEGTHDQG